MVSLEAAVSSLLPLSQTNSEIWLGDNLHFFDAPLMTVTKAKWQVLIREHSQLTRIFIHVMSYIPILPLGGNN